MPRRAATFALLASLFLLLAVTTGARCYKEDTRVVVFIQGLYTTYDGETQSTSIEGPRFSTLKAAFLDNGYREQDLLDYSYAGGTVAEGGANDGRWRPNHYDCTLTDRAANDSLSVLEDMLRDYRDAHDGVHFTLVGHSLGGYLAYLEGAREAARPDDQRLDIDVVVTLDAPLLGVDSDKKTVIDLVACEKTYIAGAQIVADKQDPGIVSRRASETDRMAAAGIRLATLGNTNDCLWNTGRCLPGQTWVDDSGTQYLDGAAARFTYEVAANPLQSHDAILGHPPAVADTIAFVGER